MNVGLAITKEEYMFLTQGKNELQPFYWIRDWNGLGELKEGTTVIVFSREWFLTQGIGLVENIVSLAQYYANFHTNVYYLNIKFNQLNDVDLLELEDLLKHEYYNVLIGNHYRIEDLVNLSSYNMSKEDWIVWLEWFDNQQSAYVTTEHKEEGNAFREKIKIPKEEIVDKFQNVSELWIVWGNNLKIKMNDWRGNIQSTKNKEQNRGDSAREALKPLRNVSKTFNVKVGLLENFDITAWKGKMSSIWLIFKKVYLKGTIFIIVGLVIAGIGAKPLIEMNVNSKNAVDEWESLKQQQLEAMVPDEKPTLEDSKEMVQNSSEKETDLIGIIKLPNKENAVGVRLGTSNEILNKGAGLDESSATKLGERGNAVVYGHREEVFWELKNIKKGDIITVETFDGVYRYEVKETRVTYPEDETIYQYTKKNMLTLVTCHPFIYMGATPERFVVEAELVEKEV